MDKAFADEMISNYQKKFFGFALGKCNSIAETEELAARITCEAYMTLRAVEEIAAELGVSPVFIEDEVEYLADYGFLDLLPGQRYRTNIFILTVPGDIYAKSKEISKEIARAACDIYIPLLLEEFKDWDENIYVPDNDKNFWYWTLIARKISDIGIRGFDVELLKKHNYYVKRKDGGEYVAFACLNREEVNSQITDLDATCGPMWRVEEEKDIAVWSLSTGYDSRVFGWEDNKNTDMQAFGLFLKGQLPKSEAVLDKYMRLYDRGFIVNRNGKDVANVIVVKEKVMEEKFIKKIYQEQTLPVELENKINKLIQEKISLEKPYYPGHMHEMLKFWNKMQPIHPAYVLEELLNRGVLKPLTEEQKKGVMIIAYSDVLPEH